MMSHLQNCCWSWCHAHKLKGSVKEPNILIYFFFLPITQWCSVSDVLFTGGREVSGFSVLPKKITREASDTAENLQL